MQSRILLCHLILGLELCNLEISLVEIKTWVSITRMYLSQLEVEVQQMHLEIMRTTANQVVGWISKILWPHNKNNKNNKVVNILQ
jgi:hypothetical protein